MKNVRLLVAFLVAMGGLVLIASQKRVQESTEISAPNVIKVAASEVRIDNIDKADNYSESLKEFLKGFAPARFPFVVDEKTMNFLKITNQPEWKETKQIDERYVRFAPRIHEGEFSRVPREIKGYYVAKIAENKDFAAVIYAAVDLGYRGEFEENYSGYLPTNFLLTTYAPNGDIIDELEVASLFMGDYRKQASINKDLQISTVTSDEQKEIYQIDRKGAIKKVEKDKKENKRTDFYF
ncbi:hypothetical protein [Raineya sp.]